MTNNIHTANISNHTATLAANKNAFLIACFTAGYLVGEAIESPTVTRIIPAVTSSILAIELGVKLTHALRAK